MGQPAPRILLISYPAQGHINPALHFASRFILAAGSNAQVTYVTTAFAHRGIAARPLPPGLSLSAFSDGYDDGFKPGDDVDRYYASFRSRGSRALRELITAGAEEGHPYTRLVYTLLLGWATDVWKTGVRVSVRESCDGIVGSEEIKRCLELVVGDESGEGFRRNAKRWRDLAREAAGEGGTSDINFKAFVDEMR